MVRRPAVALAFFAIAQSGCLDAHSGGVANSTATRLTVVVAPTVAEADWGPPFAVTAVTTSLEVLDLGGNPVWTAHRETPGGDGAPGVATFEVPAEALRGPPDGGPAIRYARLTIDAFETDLRAADIGVVNPAPSYAPLVARVEVPPGEAATVTLAPRFELGGGWVDTPVPRDSFQCRARAYCDVDHAYLVSLRVACVGGPDTAPHLYLDDVAIDCGADAVTPVPTGGPWDVHRGPLMPLVADVTESRSASSSERDGAQLSWGMTVSLMYGAFPEDAVCVLRLRTAAAPRALAGDPLVPDATWAATRWEIPLNTPPGPELTCRDAVADGDDGAIFTDDAPQPPFAHVLP